MYNIAFHFLRGSGCIIEAFRIEQLQLLYSQSPDEEDEARSTSWSKAALQRCPTEIKFCTPHEKVTIIWEA